MYNRRSDNALTTEWLKDVKGNDVCKRYLSMGVELVETFNVEAGKITEAMINMVTKKTLYSTEFRFKKEEIEETLKKIKPQNT